MPSLIVGRDGARPSKWLQRLRLKLAVGDPRFDLHFWANGGDSANEFATLVGRDAVAAVQRRFRA